MVKRITVRNRLRRKYSQTGKSNISIDRRLKAKKVGWRKSKSGKDYFEVRRNRSDKSKKTKL